MSYALVDIGNTAIKAKIMDNNGDELSSFFIGKTTQSLHHFFTGMPQVSQYLVSSVVPEMNQQIQALNLDNVYFLTHDDFSELAIKVEPKESVGIDRLVNAIAVKYKWDANLLVIDMGTAITFCRIEKGGVYRGGVICPGFEMITRSLTEQTAQLPKIQFPLDEPGVIGTSTQMAIEAGLFHGGLSMVNGLIQRQKEEDDKLAVILTGGVPKPMLSYITHDVFEKDLQFTGLDILYKKIFLS